MNEGDDFGPKNNKEIKNNVEIIINEKIKTNILKYDFKKKGIYEVILKER